MAGIAAGVVMLAACGHKTTAPPTPATPQVSPPPPAPALVAVGEWTKSATEPYRGKQDDIYFVGPSIGFFGNGAGKIFRTDDAGTTWRKLFEQQGTYIRTLGFLDDKRGFAGNIGPDSFPGVTDPTMLYRTDDGGVTWRPV
ncbi:MAG: WD40/YVTN/BNR-like repeat-containing protein, partial [Kofleriaceae bacterium]